MKEHENREVLQLIADLYRVEHEAIERGIVETREHLELRQSKSKLIVNKIWRWVDARAGKHSPESKMGKALKYASKQRDKLEKFLSDPKLELDNNRARRRSKALHDIAPYLALWEYPYPLVTH